MTHTYAILHISPETYKEVRQALVGCGYEHAFHQDGSFPGGEVINMHGIALAPTHIQIDEVSTITDKQWDALNERSRDRTMPTISTESNDQPSPYLRGVLKELAAEIAAKLPTPSEEQAGLHRCLDWFESLMRSEMSTKEPPTPEWHRGIIQAGAILNKYRPEWNKK